MDNFYKEHKGYLKLLEDLDELDETGFFLARDLAEVVGDAIQYGIKTLGKRLKNEKKKD